ncbi:MAG: type II toxin-antitoxin system PemK/MazF family toxin [Pseudomonadota bacterium]
MTMLMTHNGRKIVMTKTGAVCPLTTHLINAPLFRLPVEPTDSNGLKSLSQMMLDKISTLKKEKIGKKIGTLEEAQINDLNTAIKLWLDLQ